MLDQEVYGFGTNYTVNFLFIWQIKGNIKPQLVFARKGGMQGSLTDTLL
jgi:hypothetical protein